MERRAPRRLAETGRHSFQRTNTLARMTPHHESRPPRVDLPSNNSLRNFVFLEFALSVPFWGIGALAQAHVIPDQVMLRAAWSLTPMIAASILVYREGGSASVQALFRRIVDYRRIKSKIW